MARHHNFEEKIVIVEYYLKHGDLKQTTQKFEVSAFTLHKWVRMYHEAGPESLKVKRHHRTYTSAFKELVITEHLKQKTGYSALARKYNISSHETVRQWIIEYTEGKKSKSTFGGTQNMTKSRKTTYEERLEIVEYHETHDISIRALSERFNVSYQQAYQHVKKYAAEGQYGLEDHRGRRKPESEWTEVDKLKRELEVERRKRKKVEVENAFLKKLEELERRRK